MTRQDAAASSLTYDALGEAKRLLRATRAGALATHDGASGFPVASLVTVATDIDGAPLLLLSRLAGHTRNLDADSRCSILLARGGKGDPLAHPRLTLLGTAARTQDPRIRSRFLRRHPKASLYADFPDFSFWRLEPSAGRLNGGFARAAEISAADLRTHVGDADNLIAAEEGAVVHMNEDHADALALYATCLEREPDGAWRATGIDPEGLDLSCGDRTARVAFARRVTSGQQLRMILVDMAEQARSGALPPVDGPPGA